MNTTLVEIDKYTVFFQVLLRCHAVLQEVPSLTRHRKSSSTSDSLSHMIATMTYYIAKVMKYILFWGKHHTVKDKLSDKKYGGGWQRF